MAYYERSGNSAPAHTPPSTSPSYRPEFNAQIEMGRSTSRRVSVVKIVLAVFLCFLMLGAVILSNVQQLQISKTITEKQQNYTDLQSENIRMQSEIAGKTSNKNIQEYAENVLGMCTINASQIEYVEIQTNDVVEIPEEEQNVFVRIKNWFDSFVEYLRG
jgi:cell division protein FtsB